MIFLKKNPWFIIIEIPCFQPINWHIIIVSACVLLDLGVTESEAEDTLKVVSQFLKQFNGHKEERENDAVHVPKVTKWLHVFHYSIREIFIHLKERGSNVKLVVIPENWNANRL